MVVKVRHSGNVIIETDNFLISFSGYDDKVRINIIMEGGEDAGSIISKLDLDRLVRSLTKLY